MAASYGDCHALRLPTKGETEAALVVPALAGILAAFRLKPVLRALLSTDCGAATIDEWPPSSCPISAKSFPAAFSPSTISALEVGEHELLVLMGPSGCGKTTTLRLIAGLERPTAGRIVIAGRDVGGLPPRKRTWRWSFSKAHLSAFVGPRQSGLWSETAADARGPDRPAGGRGRRRAGALPIFFDRRPGELSVGQQQRVALGRAMAGRPKLFLLDEPLSSLDAALRRQLRHEIRRLHQRLGVPMIYVTHDAGEAMALGQRIAIFRNGRLQQAADPQTLYDRPANRFVASMLRQSRHEFS